MLDHNDDGAVGVVLNRPSPELEVEGLEEWGDVLSPPQTIFSGGPVERDSLIALGTADGPQRGRVGPARRVGRHRRPLTATRRRGDPRVRTCGSSAATPGGAPASSTPRCRSARGWCSTPTRRHVHRRPGEPLAPRPAPPGRPHRLDRQRPRRPQRQLMPVRRGARRPTRAGAVLRQPDAQWPQEGPPDGMSAWIGRIGDLARRQRRSRAPSLSVTLMTLATMSATSVSVRVRSGDWSRRR